MIESNDHNFHRGIALRVLDPEIHPVRKSRNSSSECGLRDAGKIRFSGQGCISPLERVRNRSTTRARCQQLDLVGFELEKSYSRALNILRTAAMSLSPALTRTEPTCGTRTLPSRSLLRWARCRARTVGPKWRTSLRFRRIPSSRLTG